MAERIIRWEEIPDLAGTTYAGEPLVVSTEQMHDFERITFIPQAHPLPTPSEYPTGLVEGFHTLSLLDAMSQIAMPFDPEATYGYNYGLDRVRWLAPVQVGDVLESTFTVTDVRRRGEGWVIEQHCEVHVGETQVMDAVWLTFQLLRETDGRA